MPPGALRPIRLPPRSRNSLKPAAPMSHRPPRSEIIGLLGGIGSGKSSVARLFAALGARVIDADALAHEALDDRDIRAAVRARWGPEVFGADGRVDRRALGRRVFADRRELARLTRLIHPRVRSRAQALLKRWAGRTVVLDVPLLLESPLRRAVTRWVFVRAPAAARARRTARTRGWNAGEFARRERFQAGLARKRRRADAMIDNGGTPAGTRRQVAALWAELRRASKPRGPR